MQNMTKQTGWIITGVLIVLFGCCGLSSCLWGGLTLAGFGTFETSGVVGTTSGQTPPAFGLIGMCIGIVFIAIPVLSWYFLVRGKNGEAASS
jgi:hypothetical protein